MPTTIMLSESAVAVLRFRIKGLRIPVRDRDLGAYRELVAARIMEPVSGFIGGPESSFRFTYWGWKRRDEWIAHRA